MALPKPTKDLPKFEDFEDVQVIEQIEDTQPTNVPTNQPKEEKTMQTQTLTPATTNLAPVVPTFNPNFKPFDELRNRVDPKLFAGASMFAKIVPSKGGFEVKGDDNLMLGNQLVIELESYDYRWLVSVKGAGNDGNDALYNSFDNQNVVVVEDGVETLTPIAEFKKYWEDMGKEVEVSPYVDLVGFVTWGALCGEIPEENRKIMQVQLSKTSIKAFEAYKINENIRAARYQGLNTKVKLTTKTIKFKAFSFAVVEFSAA